MRWTPWCVETEAPRVSEVERRVAKSKAFLSNCPLSRLTETGIARHCERGAPVEFIEKTLGRPPGRGCGPMPGSNAILAGTVCRWILAKADVSGVGPAATAESPHAFDGGGANTDESSLG